ncbi:MAG TPA: ABC transporter permease, partial [Gallionellaceae bacterium]|nr:ABC transporter permease [Gallionellaceae bacterium]
MELPAIRLSWQTAPAKSLVMRGNDTTMLFPDLLKLTTSSFVTYRMRSFLTGLGIAIGITAVILLTSIGEGLHQFVLAEFSQFGTNIITIQPGKTQTQGGNVGVLGSVRQLTLSDADALRHLPYVENVNPSVMGNAEVRANGKTRRITVFGEGRDFARAFTMKVQSGSFWPDEDNEQARALVVLGAKVAQELFAGQNPLGSYLRVGGQRYRVIGVMEPKGQVLGLDLDDTVFIPAARAMELLNRSGLIEMQVSYHSSADVNTVIRLISERLKERHGREDFTIISQEQALEVLSSVLDVL